MEYFTALAQRHADNDFAKYMSDFKSNAHRAREVYSENIELPDAELVENLVVDSCFLIEFFLRTVCSRESGMHRFLDIADDFVVIGNQIPFFILNEVFEIATIPGLSMGLTELTSRFFNLVLPGNKYPDPSEVHHILDLIHCCQDPERIVEEPRRCSCKQMLKKLLFYPFQAVLGIFYLFLYGSCSPRITAQGQTIAISATTLLEAGVELKKKVFAEDYETAGQLKVTFINGTLAIPQILVNRSTEILIRNLVALEMCSSRVKLHHSSYAFLMHNIINSVEDSARLRSCGILVSDQYSDVEVVEMFKDLSKYTDRSYELQHGYYADVRRNLETFRAAPHRIWRAYLVKHYFGHPLSFIKLSYHILMLFFTIFGAIASVSFNKN